MNSGNRFLLRDPSGPVRLRVAVGGDVCPGPFGAAVADPFAALRPFLSDADVRMLQFETPLVRKPSPIPKTGPNLATPPEAADALRGVFDVALLANNHCGDHGPDALLGTIRELRSRGIATVGAGANLAEAEAPLEIVRGGVRLVVFDFAEFEFGVAGGSSPGVAPQRPIPDLAAVSRAAAAGAVPVVVLHGGHEHFPLPSPRLRDLCRAFAEAGAKMVVNCHQHCPLGFEWHCGVPVLYGLGDLWFPPDGRAISGARPALWHFGEVAKVLFDGDGPFALEILPVHGCETGVSPLEGRAREEFFRYLSRVSAPIGDDAALRRFFEAWSADLGRKYLRAGASALPQDWLRDSAPREWERGAADPRPFLEMRNVFTCESHHDIVRTYLRLAVEGRLREASALQAGLAAMQNPEFASTGSPLPPVPRTEEERAAVLDFFEGNVFGRVPECARRPAVRFEEIAPDAPAMGGAAVRRRVRVRYGGPGGEGSFDILAFIPAGAAPGAPVPASLFLCNRDPAENMDPNRVKRTPFWDAERIVAHGFAAVAFHVGSVVPDEEDGFEGRLQSLFLAPGEKKTPDSWGTIAAWAWCGSRAMDWIETEPRIDARRVMVAGHSRGGKTALWCAATDRRFAMAVSNCSGCAGAKLNRTWLPESEHFAQIASRFPHWFCGNFARFAGHDSEVPFDQHQLLALVAPRALYVSSATLDPWAGQPGEFLAAKFASESWRWKGRAGLSADAEFPAPGVPVFGDGVAYHVRDGVHTVESSDWDSWLDFARRA